MKTSAARQLKKLVEDFTPEIRDAFLDSIDDVRNSVVLKNLVRAIEAGDLTAAVNMLGLEPAALRRVTAAMERAFEVGGMTTAESFPRRARTASGAAFRFDVRNSRSEAWLRDRSGQKITGELLESTREAVRTALQRGMVDGRNPTTTALDIIGRIDPRTNRRAGGILGLTPQQEQWVANARRDLATLDPAYLNRARRDRRFDKIVERAIASGEPLDVATIEKLVGRYKDSLLKYRGDVIGRTESIAALNQSEQESITQAVESGAIRESQIRRVWDSAGDSRVRADHKDMNKQTVGLREPFTFPDGSKAMFPGDTSLDAPPEQTIQCRCVARTEIDWIEGVENEFSDEERQQLLALSDDELFGGRG